MQVSCQNNHVHQKLDESEILAEDASCVKMTLPGAPCVAECAPDKRKVKLIVHPSVRVTVSARSAARGSSGSPAWREDNYTARVSPSRDWRWCWLLPPQQSRGLWPAVRRGRLPGTPVTDLGPVEHIARLSGMGMPDWAEGRAHRSCDSPLPEGR